MVGSYSILAIPTKIKWNAHSIFAAGQAIVSAQEKDKKTPVVTKSMHFQSTYTPHLQRLSNLRPFGIQFNDCRRAFLWKQAMSYGHWLLWQGELHRGGLAGF